MASVDSCLDLILEVASTIKYNLSELYIEIVKRLLKNSNTEQIVERSFNFVFHSLNKVIKRNSSPVNAGLYREILLRIL